MMIGDKHPLVLIAYLISGYVYFSVLKEPRSVRTM